MQSDQGAIGGGHDRLRVARKWRRKGLKRLNPRPEMAPLDSFDPQACALARSTRDGQAVARRPEMAPQGLEKIESAPGNGMVPKDSTPKIWGLGAPFLGSLGRIPGHCLLSCGFPADCGAGAGPWP